MKRMFKDTSPRIVFVGLCAVCVALAGGYVVLKRGAAPAAGLDLPVATEIGVVAERPALLFSSAAFDRTNGFLGLVPLHAERPNRYRTELRCDRVHFANGVGLCLAASRGVITTFAAQVFGQDFRVRHSLPLKGVPSRARVSPDGRYGAVTVFVSGDSYSAGNFSTRTTLIDMSTGKAIADLEEFAVTRQGQSFKAIDFNFWGVTFGHDSNQFFATLGTGAVTYLIQGDVADRSARTLREGVECPSLSPDGRRIVFKKRVGTSSWRLHVLDMDALADTPLAETRSVDDQVEWLDDRSIAYGLPATESGGGGSDIWIMTLERDSPRMLISHAYSPVRLDR